MSGLLRKLAIYLCSPIYKLIKYVYYIFYNLANTRFLNSEIISQFSSNIYVLVSVVMLFAFSVVILSAIVNPDLLSDNKKGVTALFKRSILALFLMVLVPFMFNILYKLQSNIMDNSLIEKIIVGTNISCQQDESESADDSTTDDTSDTVDESESKCKSGGNGGQVIAGTLISALVYPIEDNINVDEDVQKSYEAMIVEDIKHIGNFAEHINATTDGEDAGWLAGSDTNYAFVFNGLLAIVCGLGCVYILVIFSLDVAVRVFKLAFMELTAPISIVGYIAAGNKILSSWFQELVKTYVDLFIRIASIAFYLFLISNLSSFLEPFQNEDWSFVLKAFLVVGMLIFVKQVPDMISKIFGVDIKPKGGISGRLGEMAGVGKQVQNAWNAVRNPLAAAAGIGSMALGTGAHIASAIRTSGKNGAAAVKRIRADGKKFSGLRSTGAVAGAILSGTWGATVGSANSAVRSLKNGVNNKNLHSMKDEYDLYKDTHKTGSTIAGRTLDDIRMGVGLKSRADSRSAKNESLVKAQEALNSATSAAENFLSRVDSKRTVLTTKDENGNDVSMNLHQATEFISTMRDNAPVRKDGEDYAAYQKRISSHMNEINKLENQLQNNKQIEIENIISQANRGNVSGEGGIEVSYEINNHLNDARKAVKDSKINGINISNGDLGTQSKVHSNIYNDDPSAPGALDIIAEEITLQNEIKDKKGNLTKYGRQKADNDSISNRTGNKKSESNESKK